MKEKFEKLKKGELKSAWKTAHETKDEFSGFATYEDGRYFAALTDASRGESKASGRDQVVFEFTFLDGDYKGKTVRDFNGLDRAESIPFLIRKIESMGFEAPEDPDDLEDLLKKMVKAHPKFRIILKTKGEYQNLYIDKLLEEGEAPELEGGDPAHEKVSKEKPAPKPEAPAATEAATEGDDLAVGMKVKCLDDENKEIGVGEVKSIDEDTTEVVVKLDTGKSIIVLAEKLRLLPKETPKAKGGLKLKK